MDKFKTTVSFILFLSMIWFYSSCNSNPPLKEEAENKQTKNKDSASLLSGNSNLAELEIHGKIFHLNVLPDGSIWMASSRSGCYYTRGFDSAWEYIYPNNNEIDNGDFVNVLPFDSSRALIHGYLHKDTRKMIYRTTNRKSWNTVIIDSTAMEFGWVYGGFCNSKGEAWLGTTDNLILYSNDYGANWKRSKISSTTGIALANIFMSSSKTGVASTHENTIILTNDNFNSFVKIPTPVDQGLTGDLIIQKIALFNDYIVLRGFDHTYYTSKNEIHWKLISNPECLDFAVDIEANEINFISTDWKIFKGSSDLGKLTEIHSALPTKPADIKITKGTIYILDEFYYLYRINDKTEREYPLSASHKIRNFVGLDIGPGKWLGVTTNAIYESTDYGSSWKRIGGDYFAQYSMKSNDRLAILANPQIDGPEYSQVWQMDSNRILIQAYQDNSRLQQTSSNCVIFDYAGFKEIQSFSGLYISKIYERSQYYLASANNDSDSYIFISYDLINWNQLLKWENCRVNDIFINESENVYVLNTKGEIKYITNPVERPLKVSNLLMNNNGATSYPADYYSNAFYFINKQEGYSYSSGLFSHSDNYFKTMDGGRTWINIDPALLKYTQYCTLGNTRYYCDKEYLFQMNDGIPVRLLSISDFYNGDARIVRFSVDREQNIVVRLLDSNDWWQDKFIVYSKKAGKWTVIK